MAKYTFLFTLLMIFSVMAKSQLIVDMDLVWCDFESEYTNFDGFRESINANSTVSDVAGEGVFGSTIIELNYIVDDDVPETGYQMWTYPDMVDVTPYNYLAINIKADRNLDSVYLILRDDVNAHQEGNSQHPFSIGTDWEQIFLPLDSFKVQKGWTTPADLTILHLIRVMFINDVVSESTATVYIDEVGFTLEAVDVANIEPDADGINVYPNPAGSSVNVTAKPGSHISLLNLNGCALSSKIARSTTTHFSVSGLPQGIYFVRVTDKNVNTYRKMLVQ